MLLRLSLIKVSAQRGLVRSRIRQFAAAQRKPLRIPVVRLTKRAVTDLSTVHRPLLTKGEWTRGWDKFKLTDAQIEKFSTDGYLSNVRVLSEKECDALLDEYRAFLNWNQNADKTTTQAQTQTQGQTQPEWMKLFHEFHSNESGDPENVLMHALGAWRISPRFHDIIFNPAIAVPTSQLFGNRAVRLWHDQLFAKPPHHGGCVAWHQDASYWTRTKPWQHMTVHIALDEQTPDNGGLYFVPGSHTWKRNGEPLDITSRHFNNMTSIREVLTKDALAAFKPVCGLLKKGEASFHSPFTVHGSYENRSSKPRRATVVNYFADGTQSNTPEPLLLGAKAIPVGGKIEGQFFPLCFDPNWPR